MKRTRRMPLAAALVAALVLAACGGGETSEGDAGTEADASGSQTAEETEAAGEPQQGGTFTFAAISEINGLDPIRNRGFGSNGGVPAAAVYDTLMRVNEDNEVVPNMAKSLEVDPDDRTKWTMQLREGIEFTDGTPLNGEAVVFNLQRHMDPANRSQWISQVSMIEDMQADGLTVEFTLRSPWVAFPYIFTHVAGMIASPTAIREKGQDFNLAPVGAGPFKVESWEQGNELRMVRNEDYWQEGLPYLDEWIQRPIPDAQTRVAALQSGQVDATFAPYVSEPMRQFMGTDPEGFEINQQVGDLGNGLVMNTQDEHLSDVRLRRAIAHFLNAQAILDVRGYSDLQPAEGPFHRDSPWDVGAEYPSHDVEAGQQLLDEYLDDIGQDSITLTLGTPTNRQSYGELLQQMLTQPGLNVEVEALETAQYVTKVFSGDFQLTNWSLPQPLDPDLQMFQAFHSSGGTNVSQLDNAEIDAALEKGRTAQDRAAREEAYAEFSRLLAEEMPYAFLIPSVQLEAKREAVQGMRPYKNGLFLSDQIWIDE